MIENFQNIFQSREFSDITLVIENEKIQTHKILLSCSPYFKSLFSIEMMEKTKNEIELKEINKDIFKRILPYFYFKEISIDTNSFTKCYYLADQFLLDDLKMKISKDFKNIISQDSLYDFLISLSQDYSVSIELIEIFIKLIEQKFYDIDKILREKDNFSQLSLFVVQRILQSNINTNENQLFLTTVNWINKNFKRYSFSSLENFCEKTKILDNFFFHDIDENLIFENISLFPKSLLAKIFCKKIQLKNNLLHFRFDSVIIDQQNDQTRISEEMKTFQKMKFYVLKSNNGIKLFNQDKLQINCNIEIYFDSKLIKSFENNDEIIILNQNEKNLKNKDIDIFVHFYKRPFFL